MKKLQLALLLAVTGTVVAVYSDYLATQESNLRISIGEPKNLPSNLNAQAERWHYSQSSGRKRKLDITADSFRQTSDGSVLELRGVELRIFHDERGTFDLIETSEAFFHPGAEELRSDAEVVVTLGLSADSGDSGARGGVAKIRSSGMTFASKTGICSTDRYTEYEFEGGKGHSLGAVYDSSRRSFQMKSQAYLELFGSGSRPAVKMRAARIDYYELAQRIELKGAVSVERGRQHITADQAVVFLESGAIRRVEADNASGWDQRPDRRITYSSRRLLVTFTPEQLLEHVTATGSAEMRSRSASTDFRARGERLELEFDAAPGASEGMLRRVHLRDDARIDVTPLSGGGPLRRIKAGWIEVTMRENGEEMETMATHTRGSIELLPHEAAQPTRRIDADRIRVSYGLGNRMERLRAAGEIVLRSGPAPAREARHRDESSVLHTWSKDLEAYFDAESGELTRLKQWGDFRFEQGGQRGTAHEAEFRWTEHQIELTREAKVWDEGGMLSADRISLDEATGDYTAEGNVASVLEGTGARETGHGGVFSPSQRMYGTAEKMTSVKATGLLTYRGGARLWQGDNRLEADEIRIQRSAKTLWARGNVASFLPENPPADGSASGRKDGASIRVAAQALEYDEMRNQVVYTGGVRFQRQRLSIHSDKLLALLQSPEQGESRLKEAVATGGVVIEERSEDATMQRRGWGTFGRYNPAQAFVLLRGEPARVDDGRGGETRGAELTYSVRDDRLLVLGRSGERAQSVRRSMQREAKR